MANNQVVENHHSMTSIDFSEKEIEALFKVLHNAEYTVVKHVVTDITYNYDEHERVYIETIYDIIEKLDKK